MQTAAAVRNVVMQRRCEKTVCSMSGASSAICAELRRMSSGGRFALSLFAPRPGLCADSSPTSSAPLNMSADQIAAFLKTKLEQRSSSLTGAFRKLDKSNTGFLSPADFEECLRTFNIRLTRQALAAVVAKYDVNGDGYVSYQEFAAVMTGQAPSDALRKAAPVGGPPSAVERAEETFRRVLFAESKTLTAAFLKLDKDRSGYISSDECAAVFAKANVVLTPQELKMIVSRYDTNKDGSVDIRELAKLLHTKGAPFEPASARGQKRARD